MIRVNDEDRPGRDGLTVHDLLMDLDPTLPIAVVKMNGAQVPRAEWPTRLVQHGDEVRVVYIIAGG